MFHLLIWLLGSETIVNKEFQEYYDWYWGKMSNYCHDTSLKPEQVEVDFGSLDKNILATCYRINRKFKISVSNAYWNKASVANRTETMMHEFRHCFFQVGHIGIKGSYMSPEIQFLSAKEVLEQAEKDIQLNCSSLKDGL